MPDLGERARVGISLTEMEIEQMLRHTSRGESPGEDERMPFGSSEDVNSASDTDQYTERKGNWMTRPTESQVDDRMGSKVESVPCRITCIPIFSVSLNGPSNISSRSYLDHHLFVPLRIFGSVNFNFSLGPAQTLVRINAAPGEDHKFWKEEPAIIRYALSSQRTTISFVVSRE